MDNDEPLAVLYNLTEWQRFPRKDKYRGILRTTTKNSNIPVTIA